LIGEAWVSGRAGVAGRWSAVSLKDLSRTLTEMIIPCGWPDDSRQHQVSALPKRHDGTR